MIKDGFKHIICTESEEEANKLLETGIYWYDRYSEKKGFILIKRQRNVAPKK